MAPDNVDALSPRRRELKNPFREIDSPIRRAVAMRVADVYAPPISSTNQPLETARLTEDLWTDILTSTATPKDMAFDVHRIKELLRWAQTHPDNGMSAEESKLSDFSNPIVARFLLDIFSQEPRVTELDIEKRLDQIFGVISTDLFGKQPSPRNVPMKGRTESIKQYFSNEKLHRAIEFFLIEPSLLPKVPMQRPNEK